MSYEIKEASPPRHKRTRSLENVLVMQGGGVFKALVKQKIRIDIVAGTSIDAVNAAIIIGSKSDQPEKDLEDFWLEVSKVIYKLFQIYGLMNRIPIKKEYLVKKISSASVNTAIFGMPKMFVPR